MSLESEILDYFNTNWTTSVQANTSFNITGGTLATNQAASGTITITDYSNIATGTTIVLSDTAGNSKTFTCGGQQTSGTDHDTWMLNEGNDTVADNIFTMLNESENDSYNWTVNNPPSNVVTITQGAVGTAGNVTITSSDTTRVAVTGFSGGSTVNDNAITALTVSGRGGYSKSLINSIVTWETSHAYTASKLVTEINSTQSDWVASSDGVAITLKSSKFGTVYNGYTVNITKTGDLTTSTPSAFSGGTQLDFVPDPNILWVSQNISASISADTEYIVPRITRAVTTVSEVPFEESDVRYDAIFNMNLLLKENTGTSSVYTYEEALKKMFHKKTISTSNYNYSFGALEVSSGFITGSHFEVPFDVTFYVFSK